jgi:hypothetical protein
VTICPTGGPLGEGATGDPELPAADAEGDGGADRTEPADPFAATEEGAVPEGVGDEREGWSEMTPATAIAISARTTAARFTVRIVPSARRMAGRIRRPDTTTTRQQPRIEPDEPATTGKRTPRPGGRTGREGHSSWRTRPDSNRRSPA